MHASATNGRPLPPEESLDPADWGSLRALGHRMVDDMVAYLEGVRERPLWQPMPPGAHAALAEPLPREPQGAERAYADFVEHVLPYPMGNIHPRFWGWVIGTGTATGALAEMLAATMNPNVGGGEHAATHVEARVIAWCCEMMGFPRTAGGVLVTGGSMANLLGLAVARHARAGWDLRRDGLYGGPRLVVYASVEAHSSIQKAVELLGLGRESLRKVPVNPAFEMDVDALERMLAEDRAAGLRPVCVVGGAGTVNTGATDDLDRLADLCAREGLWFHVDGAFGALAALDPDLAPSLRGMERADSLAFDLHKWMYMPYGVGCILVREPAIHREAFSLTPGYLARAGRGIATGEFWPSDYGVELSRDFKALKVWMSLKEHGIARYGRLVRQNVEQARHLESLIRAVPELELTAPVPLNIVCYRWVGDGSWSAAALDAINRELLVRLHESGLAAPTYATLHGAYSLRVAITNHRSRREDFDLLVEVSRRMGAEIAAELRAAPAGV